VTTSTENTDDKLTACTSAFVGFVLSTTRSMQRTDRKASAPIVPSGPCVVRRSKQCETMRNNVSSNSVVRSRGPSFTQHTGGRHTHTLVKPLNTTPALTTHRGYAAVHTHSAVAGTTNATGRTNTRGSRTAYQSSRQPYSQEGTIG
jgi:hypothetical protein